MLTTALLFTGPAVGKVMAIKLSLLPRPEHQSERDYMGSLPVAAVCSKLLQVPPYGNTTVLREKLLFAMKEGRTFQLM